MSATEQPPAALDQELFRSIFRWSLVVLGAVVLFDLAILWNYPFPGDFPLVRGVFYVAVGLVILAAAVACAFLGYRIVTTRFVRKSWRVYAIFLPLMALVGSVIWLFLLSPA